MAVAADIHVLIVDDQRSMRTLVRSCLHELGFKNFRECGDGKEAWAALQTFAIDLVICDLHMPNLDGLGLLREVRQSPKHKGTAFIMLTSVGEVDQVKKAVELGVNNYVVKPFTLATLKRKIEAVVGTLQ
jgi:two-component system chemotaxis response regulator CheY